jgi:hypothetical protein
MALYGMQFHCQSATGKLHWQICFGFQDNLDLQKFHIFIALVAKFLQPAKCE